MIIDDTRIYVKYDEIKYHRFQKNIRSYDQFTDPDQFKLRSNYIHDRSRIKLQY